VALQDMPEFVRINLAAATAWDVSADKAGNALAKIRAATGWSNQELELFVDKVNALSDAGAAKEMDVVDMFQRAGAAAKAAGVQFDTSLAFLTAMNNVAIAPEVAARGFNAFGSTLRTATEQQARVDEGLKMIGLSAKK
ncbi:phage tail tape measure protein, partial [Lysobacter sp. TAB13]|uniref:phage tail tape measure protein n=1 Tax=Lysobacter sp. TAB13 TaxID=3233065 RepID=UPI003F96A14D